MKRKLYYLSILMMLSGCFASNVKLIENNKIYPGMSKIQINSVFAYQSILENPLLPLSYKEYFQKENKEILSDDNDRNVYYVFRNVYKPVSCNWLYCNFGDGVLESTFYSYNDAVNFIKKTEKKKYIQKKTVKIEQNGKVQEISSNQDLEGLKKISKDYKDGKITEQEFEQKKAEILK